MSDDWENEANEVRERRSARSIQDVSYLMDLYRVSGEDIRDGKIDTELAPIQIEGLTRRGSGILISANVGIGKSFMAMMIAVVAASGERIPGVEWYSPTPQKVVLIDGEMELSEITWYIKCIAERAGVDESFWDNITIYSKVEHYNQVGKLGKFVPFMELDRTDHHPYIINLIKDADLVIFDNITTLTGDGDENQSGYGKRLNALLTQIKAREITQILVHHTTKEAMEPDGKNSSKQKFYSPRGTSTFSAVVKMDLRIAQEAEPAVLPGDEVIDYIVYNKVLVSKDRNGMIGQGKLFHYSVPMDPDRNLFQGIDTGMLDIDYAADMMTDEEQETLDKLMKKYGTDVLDPQFEWQKGAKAAAWHNCCQLFHGRKGFKQSQDSKRLDAVIKRLQDKKSSHDRVMAKRESARKSASTDMDTPF